MKIVVATPVGKSRRGGYYNLFPSRWTTRNRYHCTTYYPYELAYLSSLLKRDSDHQVKMIDGNYLGYTIKKYSEVLIDEGPDIIVTESDSLTYEEDMEMLRVVKDSVPAKVITSGAFPSPYPERALRDGADYVAIGEFEESILEFINSDLDPQTIGIYPNPRRELLDLNTLPLPEDDDIKRKDYCRIYGCEYREVEVFAVRGCPYSCNFCAARNIYYAKPNFRTRNVDNVVQEIGYLRKRIPELEGIFFNEESHTTNKRYTMELCDAIVAAGLDGLHYECMTNYSSFDRELLTKMREAGYYKVRIGIETLNTEHSEKTFGSAAAKSREPRLMEVLELCRDVGMKVYVSLSVGTYGATSESDMKTFEIIRALVEDGYIQEYQASINTPMPGTPFYESAKEEGIIVTEALHEYNGMFKCVVSYPDYSAAEIERNQLVFQEHRESITRENMDRGINYSMYDDRWVRRVLDITEASERYE